MCRDIPCQSCGAMDGTVCAAHSNQLRDGKGTGIKASDYRIAALCNNCHHSIDNGNKLTKDERREVWELAHRLTIGHMFENNMIGVLK